MYNPQVAIHLQCAVSRQEGSVQQLLLPSYHIGLLSEFQPLVESCETTIQMQITLFKYYRLAGEDY